MSKTRNVQGEPSWRVANQDVEAFVTQTGGHLAPVTFDRRDRQLQPFSVAPWAKERIDKATPDILRVLRGDFFCMPFGDNEKSYGKEDHPPHGQTANKNWTFVSEKREKGSTRLRLRMNTTVRKARVTKSITLVEGHPAIYSRHTISGADGPMSLGHHATLAFPDEPECGVISTSHCVYGQVSPEPLERPENRGYSILRPGVRIRSLDSVPTTTGETVDLSRFPARRGYEDLVQLINDPNRTYAWTAVTFPRHRYVWFALKDPEVLSGTIMWFSNGGRHYPPWNGRHVNVLGLEEVTSYFHYGLSESKAKNPLSEQGYRTVLQLRPKRPLVVNMITAMATVPESFDRVIRISLGDTSVRLFSERGASVQVPLDCGFLTGSD